MLAKLKYTIKLSEPMHRAAGKAKWYLDRYVKHAPLAVRTEVALRRNRRLALIVGGKLGLGAILCHAAFALKTGAERNVAVGLRFTSPLYRPKDGPEDWLDCYFDRLGYDPTGMPSLMSDALRFDYNIARDYHLLWSHLQIKRRFISAAEDLTGSKPFVAIHYRGSDKFMESARVSADAVLGRAEAEMQRRGIGRVFIASDETAFIETAAGRFGQSAFWLPCEAMASGLTAAHFSQSDGSTKAGEALVTMAALARSHVLIRTPSHLSAWAGTLAVNQDSILVT